MRKIIAILVLFGAITVSCSKQAAPKEEEEKAREQTDAQVVETILSNSIVAISAQSSSDYTSFTILGDFFVKAIPENGLDSILIPVAEQIKECYVNDTLRVGLSNITGHFEGASGSWNYTKATDLQFAYDGSDGKRDKINFATGKELTESPVYQSGNIFITWPERMETTISANDSIISRTAVGSQYKTADSTAAGDFIIYFSSFSKSLAEISFRSSGKELDYLSATYKILDTVQNIILEAGYERKKQEKDVLSITLDSRVRFEFTTDSLLSWISAITKYNLSLEEDQSESNVEFIKAKLLEINSKTDINLFLDNVKKGIVVLEVTQDCGKYAVDLVAVYDKDSTRYQLSGISETITEKFENIQRIIDLIEKIINYLK